MSLKSYLIISIILFCVGGLGVVSRRGLISILISLEIMAGAINLALVSLSRYLNSIEAQIFVLLILGISAVEVAIGLALALVIFKTTKNITVDTLRSLKW